MKIYRNYCLKKHNTFSVDAIASIFAEYTTDDEIIEYIRTNEGKFKQVKHLIVGEGSNLLFTGDFYGMVLHPLTKYISVQSEDNDFCLIEAAAGVIWDDFVGWTSSHMAFGLENLSLIPGTVGASAVQNVGAYGVEAGDYIHSVKYIDLHSGELISLSSEQCKFSYRNSIFKNELKNNFLILSVTYKLSRKPVINTEYADLRNCFDGRSDVSPREIREAVINIRNNKLPDPEITGNAGSFFKNPVIDKPKFNVLKEKFPDLRFYELADGNYKLAAGWLIDKCGLKGFEHNGAAVHDKQALVLINKSGNATGKDITGLAYIVSEKVKEKFDVCLEPEVIFI